MNTFSPKHKKRTRGFTLIELIVVIAILAILAAILIPVVSGYINDSKEAKCYSDKNTIIRTYKTQYALRKAHEEDTSVEKVLESCQSFFPQAVISGNTVTGVCPSGGKYTCTSTAEGEVEIVCDKHVTGQVYTTEDIGAEFKTALDSRTWENGFIDSTVPNSNRENMLSLLPPGVKDSLEGKTWKYYYKTGVKQLFIYDGDISALAVGAKVPITIYDMNTGKVTTGKSSSIGTKTYNGDKKAKILTDYLTNTLP